jgi:nicotinamidase/pyrazinamidase
MLNMMTGSRSALLIVDVQKDFCRGGALAVPDGDRVVAPLNRYAAEAIARGWPVYASRDWHPAVTTHFQAYGGEWPPHCVQGTEGAAFHGDLRLPASAIVITTGEGPDEPGYSALEGHSPDGTNFLDLKARGVRHLYVGGLATDYCVKHSVLDARRAGLEVTVLTDAIAGVEVNAGDSARALKEMRAAGVRFANHMSEDQQAPAHMKK